MKKLYYFLILLIPIAIILVSITLVENISQIIDIYPDTITIVVPDSHQNVNVVNIDTYLKLDAKVLPQQAVNKTVSWTSSNSNLASIDNEGNVYFKQVDLSNGQYSFDVPSVTFTAKTVNGVSHQITYFLQDRLVRGVELTNKIQWLDLGDSHNLQYSVLPSVNPDIKNIVWASSNPSVIEINQAGKITAKQTGNATVNLNIDGFVDSFNVKAVVAIRSLNATINQVVTAKTQIDLTSYVQTVPTNANQNFIFEIENNNEVANVVGDVLTFNKAGVVNVVVKPVYTKQANLQTSFVLESTNGNVKSFTTKILPTLNASVQGQQTINLQDYITIIPADFSGSLSLELNNANIVVNNPLMPLQITAVAGGRTRATISQNNVSVSFDLNIEEYVSNIVFDHIDEENEIIETFVNPFANKATAFPSSATNKNIRYVSSDEAIATVNQAGVVEFLQSDKEVIITVTAQDGGGVVASYKILSRSTEKVVYDLDFEEKDLNDLPPNQQEYQGYKLLTEAEYSFKIDYKTDSQILEEQIVWSFESEDIPQSAFSVDNNVAKINLVHQKDNFGRNLEYDYYSGQATISSTLTLINALNQPFTVNFHKTYYFSNNKVLSFEIEIEKDFIYYNPEFNSDSLLVQVVNVFPAKQDFTLNVISENDMLGYNQETKSIYLKNYNSLFNQNVVTFKIDDYIIQKNIKIHFISESIDFVVLDAQSTNGVYEYATKNEFLLSASVLPTNTTNRNYTYQLLSQEEDIAQIEEVDGQYKLVFLKNGTVKVKVWAQDRQGFELPELAVEKTFTFTNFAFDAVTSFNELLDFKVGTSVELEIAYTPKDIVKFIEDNNAFTVYADDNVVLQVLSAEKIKISAVKQGQTTLQITYNINGNSITKNITLQTYLPLIEKKDISFMKNDISVEDNNQHEQIVIGNKYVLNNAETAYTTHSFDFRILNLYETFVLNDNLSFELLAGVNPNISGTLVKNSGNNLYTYLGKITFTLPTVTAHTESSIIIKNGQQQVVSTLNFLIANGVNVSNFAEFKVANTNVANKTIVLQGEISNTELGYKLYTNIYGNGNIMHGTAFVSTQTSSQVFAVSRANLVFNNVHFMGSKTFAGEFIKGTRRLLSVGQKGTIFKNSIISNHQDLIFSENGVDVIFESVEFRNASNKAFRLISSGGKASLVTLKNSSFTNIGSMAIELKNTSNGGLGVTLNLEGDVYFNNYLPDNKVIMYVSSVLSDLGITAYEDQMNLYSQFKSGFYSEDVILQSEDFPEVNYMAVATYIEKGHDKDIVVNTNNFNNKAHIVESELNVLIATLKITQIKSTATGLPENPAYPNVVGLPWAK